MGYFSNGTEGAIFEERFCSRCVHSDYREGKDFGDADNPPCPIWMAHLLHAYDLCNEDPEKNPAKQMLDMLIRPVKKTASDGIAYFDNECQMFHARDAGANVRMLSGRPRSIATEKKRLKQGAKREEERWVAQLRPGRQRTNSALWSGLSDAGSARASSRLKREAVRS